MRAETAIESSWTCHFRCADEWGRCVPTRDEDSAIELSRACYFSILVNRQVPQET